MERESEIYQRLTSIETKLDMKLETIGDHEKRIRFLERYAFMLLGIFTLIVLAVDILKK